jgi:hypothetical protein
MQPDRIRTRKELSEFYQINAKTLTKWLIREQISLPKGLLTPRLINEIIKKFGKP